MATREPIDALLDVLSPISQEDRNTEQVDGGNLNVPGGNTAMNNDNSSPSLTPTSLRRRLRYNKILSSSSLKKGSLQKKK